MLATRWTVRAYCSQRIIDNYQYLYSLWNESLKEAGLTAVVKSRIIGSKAQMITFELYFGLKLGKLLYSHTDKLSQSLQNEKTTAVSSKRLAMLTIETISSMRNEEHFNTMYDLRLKEIKKLHFIENPVLKRKRETPNYTLLNFFVDGYKSISEAYYPDNPGDNYRQQFYRAIDVLIFSVRGHFDKPSF